MHCPLCRQPLDTEAIPLNQLLNIPMLTRQEMEVLSLLIKRYPNKVVTEAIIDHLYSNDPSGGPEGPRNVVAQLIRRIRIRIEPYGWTIPRKLRGLGSNGMVELKPLKIKIQSVTTM